MLDCNAAAARSTAPPFSESIDNISRMLASGGYMMDKRLGEGRGGGGEDVFKGGLTIYFPNPNNVFRTML